MTGIATEERIKIRQVSDAKNEAYKTFGKKLLLVKPSEKIKIRIGRYQHRLMFYGKLSYPNNFNYSISTIK